MTQVTGRPEGIRAWYSRTTSKARKALLWFTVIGVIGAIGVFWVAPVSVMERIQQFNGAMTIPLFGLIWIVGFIYMFLIPQREAGFRSQEWVETMVTTFQDSMVRQISPAVKIWTEIGTDVKAEIPVVLGDVRAVMKKVSETMDDLRMAAKRLTEAVEKNEKILQDAKPAIEALRRIETKVELEIKAGLFENLQTALEAVRELGGMPPSKTVVQVEEDAPINLQWAIESIRKNAEKAKVGAKS